MFHKFPFTRDYLQDIFFSNCQVPHHEFQVPRCKLQVPKTRSQPSAEKTLGRVTLEKFKTNDLPLAVFPQPGLPWDSYIFETITVSVSRPKKVAPGSPSSWVSVPLCCLMLSLCCLHVVSMLSLCCLYVVPIVSLCCVLES